MKKITKLALVMAATVVAGAFMGCADKAGDDADGLSLGKEFALENKTTTNYNRNYVTTKTKHTSAIAEIVMPKSTGLDNNGDGVVGMIFAVKENEDKTQNFGLVGLRRNKAGEVQYYISYYTNVSLASENLNKANNFCDKNGKKIGETGCLATEADISGNFVDTGIRAATGDVTVYVELLAGGTDTDNDGKVESDEGDGSYEIKIYDSEAWDATAKKLKTGALAKKTGTIVAAKTGDTKATQYKLGMYLNAYANSTLKGKVTLVDTINECEIEFED